jgi:hypothetical protein
MGTGFAAKKKSLLHIDAIQAFGKPSAVLEGIWAGFACWYYSCFFGKFVVQIFNAWISKQDGLIRFLSKSGSLSVPNSPHGLRLDANRRHPIHNLPELLKRDGVSLIQKQLCKICNFVPPPHTHSPAYPPPRAYREHPIPALSKKNSPSQKRPLAIYSTHIHMR